MSEYLSNQEKAAIDAQLHISLPVPAPMAWEVQTTTSWVRLYCDGAHRDDGDYGFARLMPNSMAYGQGTWEFSPTTNSGEMYMKGLEDLQQAAEYLRLVMFQEMFG